MKENKQINHLDIEGECNLQKKMLGREQKRQIGQDSRTFCNRNWYLCVPFPKSLD
jgi:hypothetical protein